MQRKVTPRAGRGRGTAALALPLTLVGLLAAAGNRSEAQLPGTPPPIPGQGGGLVPVTRPLEKEPEPPKLRFPLKLHEVVAETTPGGIVKGLTITCKDDGDNCPLAIAVTK